MDDFSWGNTRLVIGEGNNKKVIMADDEKFHESMIPLKKFSEYEAETWETQSMRSGHTGFSQPSGPQRSFVAPQRQGSESPYTASQNGDFYRDTNLTMNNSSNPNLRLPANSSNMSVSHQGSHTPPGGVPQPQFGTPQLPTMPFMGLGGSMAGSEYGGMPQMGFAPQSIYGMPIAQAPRNTMMTNINMFGGGSPVASGPPQPQGMARMSTFSMATHLNPFTSPSASTDPTDDELLEVLRHYLATQDLMTVTKK